MSKLSMRCLGLLVVSFGMPLASMATPLPSTLHQAQPQVQVKSMVQQDMHGHVQKKMSAVPVNCILHPELCGAGA